MKLCFTASAQKCLCINSKVKLRLKSVYMLKLSNNFFLTHCLIDIACVMNKKEFMNHLVSVNLSTDRVIYL